MNMGGSNKLNPNKEQDALSVEEPIIRTMAKDIEKLSKQGAPPEGLPVSSISQIEQKKQKKIEEEAEKQRIKQEAEERKKAEEKARREAEEMEKARQEAEKQRIAEQKAEQERIKVEQDRIIKENEERARAEQEKARREAEEMERVKKQTQKQKEAEQKDEQEKIKRQAKEQKKAEQEAEKSKDKDKEPQKKKGPIKLIIICLVIILIAGGLGGFVYWWNYIKSPTPLPAAHYQCQDYQCVSVEGEGTDQCQINQDCQPAEPVIPEALIPVDETKTIELIVGQENLIPDLLKSIVIEEQATSTLRRILIKLTDQEQKKYMDFNTFISSLRVSLPENIRQSIADSDIESENYTLFFYSQAEENCLGLIVKMTEDSILTQNLRDWENSIIVDFKQFLLKDEIPAAATEEFQDNIYKDVSIRYINFPSPDLSIDYAIIGNKLIITTSQENMYAVIDRLKPISEN